MSYRPALASTSRACSAARLVTWAPASGRVLSRMAAIPGGRSVAMATHAPLLPVLAVAVRQRV